MNYDSQTVYFQLFTGELIPVNIPELTRFNKIKIK